MSMSEFSKEWPLNGSHIEHARMTAMGQAELESKMKMPEDDRLRIAYGLEVIGGLDAAVLAMGEPGAGKTKFGNLTLGSEVRADIENTDTEDTLFGYQNPIKSDERIPGKFSGKLTPENPLLFANEISQLANTGPLHRLSDDNTLVINGEMIPMHNAVMYATSNFPNGQRVHELDDAIRSRFAVEVLFGDADSEFARELHALDLGARALSEEVTLGLVPNPEARADVRRSVLEAYPVDGRSFGGYVTDMIEAVNDSRMLRKVSHTDKRLSNGWQQAVRAKLLVERAPDGSVDAEQASMVAALVLPTVTSLTHEAKSQLASHLEVPKIDPLTEAIARRRLLASLAYNAHEAGKPFPEAKVQQRRDAFRRDYSYATANGDTDKIDAFIEEVVEGKTNEARQPDASDAPKRHLFRRR